MIDDDIPAQLVVDSLRDEIARLNDERISLTIRLQYALALVETLQLATASTAETDGVAESHE